MKNAKNKENDVGHVELTLSILYRTCTVSNVPYVYVEYSVLCTCTVSNVEST